MKGLSLGLAQIHIDLLKNIADHALRVRQRDEVRVWQVDAASHLSDRDAVKDI
jgi:hypothetical protein